VTVISTSPLAAPIRILNFSTTPARAPSLLLSARVCSKFFTVPLLSFPPRCFSSSAMIWLLSSALREGADRRVERLASFSKTLERDSRDLAVGSRTEVFAAAVYYGKLLALRFRGQLSVPHCPAIVKSAPGGVEIVPERSRRFHRCQRERLGASSRRCSVRRQLRSLGWPRNGQQLGREAHLRGKRY
jgi:hypothetical protein